jgi:dienelactone hydrolase
MLGGKFVGGIFVRFRTAALTGALAVWSLLAHPTPGAAQEIVKFEASDPYASDKVLLRGELFKPEGAGPFPAVILMHGCGGWRPAVRYSLHNHADHLVKNGYVVLSLDSFGPRGYSGDELCASNARLRAAIDYRTHDAFDALRYLQALSYVDPADIFLMGQSNGGSVAMQAAAIPPRRSVRSSLTTLGAAFLRIPGRLWHRL